MWSTPRVSIVEVIPGSLGRGARSGKRDSSESLAPKWAIGGLGCGSILPPNSRCTGTALVLHWCCSATLLVQVHGHYNTSARPAWYQCTPPALPHPTAECEPSPTEEGPSS